MAKLTEIEDGESVGIGLAGSELPRRRRARRYVAVSALLAFAMVVLKRAASYACAW